MNVRTEITGLSYDLWPVRWSWREMSEESWERRDRKKRRRMKITGRGLFTIQEIQRKRAEEIEMAGFPFPPKGKGKGKGKKGAKPFPPKK